MVPASTSPPFVRRREGRFRLEVDGGLSQSWVTEVVRRLEELPEDEHIPGRRRGVVSQPSHSSTRQAFVKIFHHTSPRHRKWRRRAPIQRLRRRYADHEGRALRYLGAKGVPVPRLLFFGEEWSFGVRRRGVVATEALSAPTLHDVLSQKASDRWARAYSEALARIHASGLSHGDAHGRNFLVQDSRIVAIDLENSRSLTRKKRTGDLVAMVSSVLLATGSESNATRALASYDTAVGETYHVATDELMRRGREDAAHLL